LKSRRANDANASAERAGRDAARRFRERYPDVELAPVAVVIPAFNEEDCIAGVLDAIPREACGLAVETIVVDDGSRDRTGEIAAQHGAYVARLERNCGQGAAFRVGYRLAREYGARFLVTLDADGQWDPADIPSVLEPVAAGEADFVLGSRVLGSAETDDAVRRLGVRVFAGLVRVLGGVEVTDTSSGLRAMIAEVTATVPQQQPQYQSAELLLGAIHQGYRIAERPVVMHKRVAGESKKGHNVFFGLHYAQAILHTWWRVRRSAPRAESRRAPEAARARQSVEREAERVHQSVGPDAPRR
jgi:glycosyltransferase involved in cell wall biosynthesis